MRSIALDVHRDFCEVAIKDAQGLRLSGRVKTEPEELALFAGSLAPDDQVALEASEPALAIARILEPHVGRVVIANTLELPADESETVTCCLREVDFLDAEIAWIERELAAQALSCEEIRRPMSVPGVSLVSAATLVAVAGDVKRFSSPKKLVSYVGLDPRVRRSGETPARHGRISKQGSPEARHVLCEAAWVLIRTPGPLRGFYERVRARRGAQVALVATARKLSVPFWHLLTREEDYAFERPTLTRRKLLGLELKAKDGRRSWPSGHALGTQQDREREREFAEQVETADRRLVADWRPKAPRSGAGATRGRAPSSHLHDEETAARQGSAPEPALWLVVTRTNDDSRTKEKFRPDLLTFLLTESPSAATSDRCGWFSGWRRTDPLTFCRPGGLTDRMSCRPPPPEDRRRDLIGAWH